MGAFLFSLAVLTLWAFVWSLMFKGDLSFKEVVLLLPSIVALVHQIRRNKAKAKPFRLTASFDSGIFGGFAGGIVAGLVIGIFDVKLGGSVWAAIVSVLAIVSAAAIGGAVLGGSIQLMILWLRHLEMENKYPALVFNEISGGLMGGAIGGLLVGLGEIYVFGRRDDPYVGNELLVTGVLFGVTFITWGTLFYDYRGKWVSVIRAFMMSLLITACMITACVIGLQLLKVQALIESAVGDVSIYEGGAILGVVIGLAAGLQVGLTQLLYRLREVRD